MKSANWLVASSQGKHVERRNGRASVSRCPYCGQESSGGPHPICVRRISHVPGDWEVARLLKWAIQEPDFPQDIRSRMLSSPRIPQFLQYSREMLHRVGGDWRRIVRIVRMRKWDVLALIFVGHRWRIQRLYGQAVRNMKLPPRIRKLLMRRWWHELKRVMHRQGISFGDWKIDRVFLLALAIQWKGGPLEDAFWKSGLEQFETAKSWVEKAVRAGIEPDIELAARMLYETSLIEQEVEHGQSNA